MVTEARERAYSLIEVFRFKGKHFHGDTTAKALN